MTLRPLSPPTLGCLIALAGCVRDLPAGPRSDDGAPAADAEAGARPRDAAAPQDDALAPQDDALAPQDDALAPQDDALARDARVSCGPPPPPQRAPDFAPSLNAAALRVPACMDVVATAVVPAGATWQVTVSGAPADARLRVFPPRALDALGDPEAWPAPLAEAVPSPAGDALVVQIAPVTSGEVVLALTRTERSAPLALPLSVTCATGCDLRATRYPIVLVHGYFGTDRFFGLLDYFHDVPERLRALGFDVSTPVTDAFNWSTERAAQLAPQVDAVLSRTGARKVNLIGHSQGGMDARILVSGLGYADRVASITTVSTPHAGTPLLIDDIASVQDFGVEYMAQTFNSTYPDSPSVRYFSWSARSCGALDFGCQRETGGEVVDAVLTVFHASLTLRVGDNDGFVPTASMVWGEHLGVLSADHLDGIGQIADPPFGGDPFDHRAFYAAEADRFAAAGL